MRSLQSRLGTSLLVSLVGVFILLWLLVSISIRYLAEDYTASRLHHDAQTLLSSLQIVGEGGINLDHSRIDAIYTRPFSGHYFSIHVGDEVIRSRSLWDQSLHVEVIGPGAMVRAHHTGPQDQPLLILSSGYNKGGKQITIAVAEEMTAIEEDISEFQRNFALMALGSLLLLIIVQIFILRLGLHPLIKIRNEVSLLESGEKDRLSEHVPDEVKPLIREVNHLLQVLGTRIQRSRNALGDLAHSLKKPLTALTQLQDNDKVQQSVELRQTLETQIGSMRGTIDRILKRARLAGEGPVGVRFDISNEIPFLLETLQKMHLQKKVDVELEVAEDLEINADREDMLELLGNLLDNAFKWAECQIRLSIVQQASTIKISVEDDGPGIPINVADTLTERGARLDEQVEGHGLGLAIVQDIVRLYKGHIELDKSERLQGLRASVMLPKKK
ncbi:MAG: HAMP domain-containing histidine kinase [Gammaproteobacteria bacterium]|nr:MAG: HAMP domain-containing histidine kinase [Gammaproteobacteria bacterium]